MKKRNGLIAVALGFSLLGCTGRPAKSKGIALSIADTLSWSYPDLMPIDSANKMLGSYLNSINYQSNDTDIQSVIFDARLLRNYLNTIFDSGNITNVKMMFAHKLSYINSGHMNQPAGYHSNALTIIIAAYDSSGNYRFYPGNYVIDKGLACPTNCPPTGSASSSLLPSIQH
ncbi:hypothetical protein BDD43_0827 [Mucilaginibacter gracilis]|uniref:Uncharacterized protein n=1 Tax=Mucilaginibacter gracilis TaxID=423350 RepID=A0A495IVB8_9SPHI|nr:hypothetical protein [Mucilaginibacter gracilis]RKR80695.1 hypothetical protein BDD43_0827 [Mucilaginibacter gracilis]